MKRLLRRIVRRLRSREAIPTSERDCVVAQRASSSVTEWRGDTAGGNDQWPINHTTAVRQAKRRSLSLDAYMRDGGSVGEVSTLYGCGARKPVLT